MILSSVFLFFLETLCVSSLVLIIITFLIIVLTYACQFIATLAIGRL